jgi:transcription elongation factor GreB
MSRAFVREADGDAAEDLPPLPESPHPNRVTPAGLGRLHRRLDEALRRRSLRRSAAEDPSLAGEGHRRDERELAREIAWLERRIASAIVEPPPADRSRIALGARVSVEDGHGALKTWQIVGEDDAAPEQGRISWMSPLARALEGARAGDSIEWSRPAGDQELLVREVGYEE